MASDTKSRESWDEQETSNRNIAQSNQLKLSRVFRFNDPQTGAPQISDFPDSNRDRELHLSRTCSRT